MGAYVLWANPLICPETHIALTPAIRLDPLTHVTVIHCHIISCAEMTPHHTPVL